MRVVIHGANASRVDVPVRSKARDRAGCSCGGSRDALHAPRAVAGRGTHIYIHDAEFTSHKDERKGARRDKDKHVMLADAATAGAGYRLANAKEYLQSRAGRGGSSGNQLGFNFDGRP